MKTSTACGNEKNSDVTMHMNFQQEEENLQKSEAFMGEADGSNPPECSAQISQEVLNDSTDPHSEVHAVSTQPNDVLDLKEHGNLSSGHGISAALTSTQNIRACGCDCEKRLRAIEKSYRMKLHAAQLQMQKYQRDLAEQSHKAIAWQRKVMVMQSALKAMRLKRRISPIKSACSEKPVNHAED